MKGVRFQVNGKTISFVMNQIIHGYETDFNDGEDDYIEHQCEIMVLNGDGDSVRVRTAESVLDFLINVAKEGK